MSKNNSNSIQSYAIDNQDHLNYSEMMEIGGIKQSDTIGTLKYDNVYVLDIMGDNLQDKLLKTLWIMIERMMNTMRKFCH